MDGATPESDSTVYSTVEVHLAGESVRSICEFEHGVLWLATGDGIVRLDGSRPHRITSRDGLADDDVMVIDVGPQGDVWCGTNRGISRYDPAAGGFVALPANPLAGCMVTAIAHDLDGRVWFGTLDDGVHVVHDGAFEPFSRMVSEPIDLSDVQAILCDSAGRIWLGGAHGLARYDAGHVELVDLAQGSPHGLVTALCEDPKGGVWVGVDAVGVVRLSEDGLTALTREDGLVSDYVQSLHCDEGGLLWVGTSAGVSLYDGVCWSTIGTADGVTSPDVRAIHRDPSGAYWLGTGDGLTEYRRGKSRPTARIEAVTAGERHERPDTLPPITTGTPVTFEFSSPSLSLGPRRATFRTRLQGHDDAWGAPLPDRETAYPTLPAGDYVFHAQAVDRDLNYSEPATIALTVYTDVRDLRLAAMQAELDQLRREAGAKYRFDDIVGQSPAMQQVFALMAKAVDSGLTVLLSGPTGTGKELVARQIHYSGARRNGPLQPLNCAEIPSELLASTLFGHRRGAFTGAHETQLGVFEAADGGTVLLDEIGEMSMAGQAHLLRVLEERQIQRVGEHETRPIDVRIIAMTNRNLHRDVDQGRFRKDLYYRLTEFPIPLPPLRDRVGDIALLADHFLMEAAPDGRTFSDDARAALGAHDWPGHVRELANAVRQAVAIAPAASMIEAWHLPSHIAEPQPIQARPGRSLYDAGDDLQRRLIQDALRDCGGNKAAAARRLGVHSPNLYRLIKRLGITPAD